MMFTLDVRDVQKHADALVSFHRRYADFFRSKTRDVSPHALDYLKGQLLCDSRRNMQQMSRQVSRYDEQALSHFISNSPWQDAPLLELVGKEASELLTPSVEGQERALFLDESGIAKQGDASVGVARQYCGALGKVDNCQVGVYLAYSNLSEATLIDRRLYLPEVWTEDKGRCEAAGIPEAFRTFKTKAQLGLDMILQVQRRGVLFDFVGMDGHYGEQPWFLTALDRVGITYVADIPCNTRVYLEYPRVGVPKRRGKRGRSPSKVRVLEGEVVEVRSLLSSLPWQVLKVRDTARGELWIRFAAIRVWRVEDELPYQKSEWLLVRQELDGSDTKYSFSNSAPFTPLLTLARRQSGRYWVERSLQDAKGLAGLDEYQVLGWRGWHHHMTMVILAMLFLLELKQTLGEEAPMLTLQDTVELLEVVLPRKEVKLEDAVKLIEEKHRLRERSRESYWRRQRKWLEERGFL